MSRRKMMPAILIVGFVLVSVSISCDCSAPLITSLGDDRIAGVYADGEFSVNLTINAVSPQGYLVVSSFRAIIHNPSTDQSITVALTEGSTKTQIDIPLFAEENDTLEITVMGRSDDIEYGNASLQLTNISAESNLEIDVLIPNPPENYNSLIIFSLVIVFAGILAAYAIFARWLVGKMVVSRANQIRLKEWKRKGGGQMGR